jgi:glutaredoxin-related protein
LAHPTTMISLDTVLIIAIWKRKRYDIKVKNYIIMDDGGKTMITVYGTPICKYCLAMKIIFEELDVDYHYIIITDNTVDLRAFLKMREEEPVFTEIKKNGGIGIPFFMKDDKKSLDINEALSWEGIAPFAEDELNRITEKCGLLFK